MGILSINSKLTRVLGNSKVSWGGSCEPQLEDGGGGCRRKMSLRCVRIAAIVIGDVGTKMGGKASI